MTTHSDWLIKQIKQLEFENGVDWVLSNLRKGNDLRFHYVFSKDKAKALQKIEELIGDKFVVKSKNNKQETTYQCIYDVYKYSNPSIHTRGIRCNTVHIDSNLLEKDRELVEKVILSYAVRGNSEDERVFYF